jgi:uncharacterized membrane protein YphA (DoxX/SURF4 family)
MADLPNPPVVQVRRQRYVPGGLVLALVLLRVVVGWHFYSEGTKKLAYNPKTGEVRVAFTSEGFLRQAVGPAADVIRQRLPEFYNWEELLAKPRAGYPSTVEELKKRADWEKDYARRVKEAKAAGKPMPVEFPPYSPYFDWADRIDAGWHEALARFSGVKAVTDEQKKQGAAALEARRQELADYLASEADAIAEWEHELYRLTEWEAAAWADEVPFQVARIQEKRGETKAASAAWIAEVRDIERSYFDDLRELLSTKQTSNPDVVSAVDEALADSTSRTLHRIDLIVTCAIIAIGACLMLGLFTRQAALGGITFLVMVMATQPPWIPGAELKVFHYQLVEVAALFVLFASAAGQWAGLDFFLHRLAARCCGRQQRVRT